MKSKTSQKKLSNVYKIEDVLADLAILHQKITDIGSEIGRIESSLKKKTSKIQEVRGNGKIHQLNGDPLQMYQEMGKEDFIKKLKTLDLQELKKWVRETGYGLPKVTSRLKNKDKIIANLIIEVENLSKKGDALMK